MVNRTRKQTVAGVLDIIAGTLGAISGEVVFLLSYVGSDILRIPPFLLLATSASLAILGTIAFVGGIYALYGKTWGIALIGSVCSFIFLPLVGIPSVILTALAKGEFNKAALLL